MSFEVENEVVIRHGREELGKNRILYFKKSRSLKELDRIVAKCGRKDSKYVSYISDLIPDYSQIKDDKSRARASSTMSTILQKYQSKIHEAGENRNHFEVSVVALPCAKLSVGIYQRISKWNFEDKLLKKGILFKKYNLDPDYYSCTVLENDIVMSSDIADISDECQGCSIQEDYDNTASLELNNGNGLITLPCKVVDDKVFLYRRDGVSLTKGEIINLGELSKSIPLPQFFLDNTEARFITHSKRIPEPPEVEIFIRKAEEVLNNLKKLLADFKLSDFNAQDAAKNIPKGSDSGLGEYDGLARKLIGLVLSNSVYIPDPVQQLKKIESDIMKWINTHKEVAIKILQKTLDDLRPSNIRIDMDEIYEKYIKPELTSMFSEEKVAKMKTIFDGVAKQLFELINNKRDEIRQYLERATNYLLLLLKADRIEWVRLKIRELIDTISGRIEILRKDFNNRFAPIVEDFKSDLKIN